MNPQDKLPAVSVLMPVFNAAQFLPAAIESLLNQTFTNLELLIVDDCSTDRSLEVIQNYAARDCRIRVLVNEENCGLSYCRNLHIKEARGKYLALLDADDIAEPHRLQIQKQFLDKNPRIGIVGSSAKKFGTTKNKNWQPPLSDWDIKSYLLLGVPFCNPSVMMRTDVVRQNNLSYCVDYVSAMDYLFWVDACPVTIMQNIPAALVRYRIHPGSNSAVHKNIREENHIKVAQKHLARFGLDVQAEVIRRYRWRRALPCNSVADVLQVKKMIHSILSIQDFYGYNGVSPFMKKDLRKKYIKLWAHLIARVLSGKCKLR